MKEHAHKHYETADFKNSFGRKTVEKRKNENQEKAWKLAEKLRNAAVEFSHSYDFRKIVVDHSLVKSVAQSHGHEADEKRNPAGGGIKSVAKFQSELFKWICHVSVPLFDA